MMKDIINHIINGPRTKTERTIIYPDSNLKELISNIIEGTSPKILELRKLRSERTNRINRKGK